MSHWPSFYIGITEAGTEQDEAAVDQIVALDVGSGVSSLLLFTRFRHEISSSRLTTMVHSERPSE